MEIITKRSKKDDKHKKTLDLYGKFSKKHVRISLEKEKRFQKKKTIKLIFKIK
jgi:hypothetical protein